MSNLKSLFTPEDAPPAAVLSRADCESITKRTLGFATADETRVTINSTARCDTRFAVNQVSTSGDDINSVITIRSSFGTRSASVTINKTDDASLAAAVKDAEVLAHLSAENPEHVPELGPHTFGTGFSIGHGLGELPSPADRAAAVKAIATRARAAHAVATGYMEAQLNATAVATSRGLFGYQMSGGATLTVTARRASGNGSGWAGGDALSWGGIDAAAIGAQATKKATDSRDPVAVEPGRWTVVLEPTAVGNLVQLIGYAAQARAADEGRSFFSKPGVGNKIGTKVVSEHVSLYSDPADTGALFTSEGLPTERVMWIEKGILRTLNYDQYWAAHTGTRPTAAPPSTLRMSGGTSSLPKMIASTEMGVLVTRFWYIRSVDPRTILYTGLTRDGTFLIKEGKVSHSLKNFRYNESPIFILNSIDAMGTPVRVSASEDGSPGDTIIMPPLKCHDFTFTSFSDAV